MLKLLCLAVIVALVAAHRTYLELIPNGYKVPDPCTPGTFWSGVGHFALHGGGPRNEFGLDFEAEGHVWTQALCEKDSDGDGVTNGEELGDPQCIFTTLNNPQLDAPKGHPGICEPVGSSACAQQNFTCA